MNKLEYHAKGKRSTVFLSENKTVIKKANPGLEARISHEADMLKLLNKYKIGPRLISYRQGELEEEFIEGKTIETFIEETKNKIRIKKVIKKVLNQCRILDELKINKEEMSNPYKHIIIKNLKPVMIDFERCRYSKKVTNVTQFFQYIMKYKLISLNEKNKQLLKNYKANPTETNYKNLLKLI